MNFDSKYYDPIRPLRAERAPRANAALHAAASCAWEGCNKPAAHRAPLTARELQRAARAPTRWLCAEHIGPFNQAFNFFEGLSDDAAGQWQQDALTGHRPTWKRHGGAAAEGSAADWMHLAAAARDQLKDWHRASPPGGTRTAEQRLAAKQRLTPGQRRALETLDLPPDASPAMLTRRYKQLVKRYHPDCNGGARRYERALTRTLQAYHYLKASGFGRAA